MIFTDEINKSTDLGYTDNINKFTDGKWYFYWWGEFTDFLIKNTDK